MGLDVVEVQYALDGETHLHDMVRRDFSCLGHLRLWSSRFTLKVSEINPDYVECQVFQCNFADLIDETHINPSSDSPLAISKALIN